MTLSEKKLIDCIFYCPRTNFVEFFLPGTFVVNVAELSEDFVFIPRLSVVRYRIVVAETDVNALVLL